MKDFSLVFPMAAMVALTVIVLATLFRARVRAVCEGKISVTFYKTYQGEAEPDSIVQLSRHFSNIFETPILFYIVCLVAMIANQATLLFQVLAWSYVAIRALHAYIHIGSNKLRSRINVYVASWGVLILMWAYVTIRVITL